MDDDGSLLLTIGQLTSRTGLAVRTIRYWSGFRQRMRKMAEYHAVAGALSRLTCW